MERARRPAGIEEAQLEPVQAVGEHGKVEPEVEDVFLGLPLVRLILEDVAAPQRRAVDGDRVQQHLHFDQGRRGNAVAADRLDPAERPSIAPEADLTTAEAADLYPLVVGVDQVFGPTRREGRDEASELGRCELFETLGRAR